MLLDFGQINKDILKKMEEVATFPLWNKNKIGIVEEIALKPHLPGEG